MCSRDSCKHAGDLQDRIGPLNSCPSGGSAQWMGAGCSGEKCYNISVKSLGFILEKVGELKKELIEHNKSLKSSKIHISLK